MSIEIAIILVLLIVVLGQTLYFVKKNKKYIKIKDAEAEIKRLYEKVEQDSIRIEKQSKEKVLLMLKFRDIINKRYHSQLNILNSELVEREEIIKEKEDTLKTFDITIRKKQKEIDELIEKTGKLSNQINEIELDIYSAEYGLYKSKYDFLTSEKYKVEIEDVRREQKWMVKNGNACVCYTNWTVENSKCEGNKMVNRNRKMMLRAFNGECDAIISKATYKNINTMEKRLNQSFERINKLNEVMQMWLAEEYKELKMKELFLVYEYHEKVFNEKEELRIRKMQIKEEERAQKEFEKALIKAEKEAERYSKALEQAKKELQEADNKSIEKLNMKIKELEKKLEEAEKNKRAISQAQITKSGHIYIISNVGSFGEDVYKIGMTRRLEPFDRVRELNGPSVPFLFDLHAMIFSKNAPELELKLHRELSYAKLNRVNKRKEFFKVKLEDIEEVVKELNENDETEFKYEHEAKEYRLSEKLRLEEEEDAKKLVG